MIDSNFLVNMKKYYTNLPHQQEAIALVDTYLDKGTMLDLTDEELIELQKTIPPKDLEEIVTVWRTEPEPIIKPVDWQNMPYNTQLDNPIAPHSTCNSSSHWMMCRSINKAVSSDDSTYVKQVMDGKFGGKGTRNPSIYWDVHVRGLAYYGVKIQIMSNNLDGAIEQACEYSIVTPVNILHRGHISNPTGGHVVGIAGYNFETKQLLIHDPYGELDYINGISNLKASGKYWVSRKNFEKRWQGNWSRKV